MKENKDYLIKNDFFPDLLSGFPYGKKRSNRVYTPTRYLDTNLKIGDAA
jgi:hypothetical protein